MSERPGFRLSDFDYDLPAELIAQTPAAKRTESRLMHVAGTKITDRAFADLPGLLAPGDLVVLNDTKVIRSRLHGRRETGGRVELLLERIVAPDEAWMQLSASHPPKPGGRLLLDGGASAIVQERDGRFVRLRFDADSPLDVYLERHGEVPLPPYIRRAAGTADSERYQTIYARHPGAVAAPTAGLHFDAAMLDRLRSHGVTFATLTLHVGAGTFQPVRVDDTEQHVMHSEWGEVPQATADAIASAKRVVSIGTTALRLLESVARDGPFTKGRVRAWTGETDIFITPGFQFRAVDLLLTNFHLPRSTLFMLVSAFAGLERMKAAYAHAVAQRYRFYSYGDCCLLRR